MKPVKQLKVGKRKYTRHPGSKPPGRPAGAAGRLARKEGISLQQAWYRLHRKSVKQSAKRGGPLAVLDGMD
jgi:hypothetical protein